ncbi:MAG: hypothetical protein ACFFCO_13420 [Promethearchaeota archaeon]
MKNKLPLLVGIISGLLMIFSGMTGGAGLWGMLLGWALSIVTVTPEVMLVLTIFLSVLNFIGAFGGFVVILGSLLLVTSHVRKGKFIISVGAGLGILGLFFHYYGIFTTQAWIVAILLLVLPAPGIFGCMLALYAQFKAKTMDTPAVAPSGGED